MIKSSLAFFISVLFFGSLSSQDSIYLAYKGLTKDQDVSFIKYHCGSLVFDENKIQTDRRDKCNKIFMFNELGIHDYILMDQDSNVLMRFKYDIKELPEISAMCAMTINGLIQESIFKSQSSIFTNHTDPDFKEEPFIESFKITAYRDKEKLFSRLNMHAEFNTEIKHLIKDLKKGDKVEFTRVMVQIRDFNPFQVNDISLRISD